VHPIISVICFGISVETEEPNLMLPLRSLHLWPWETLMRVQLQGFSRIPHKI